MKLLRKPFRHLCITALLCAGTLQSLPAAHASIHFHMQSAAAHGPALKSLNQNPLVEAYKALIGFMQRFAPAPF